MYTHGAKRFSVKDTTACVTDDSMLLWSCRPTRVSGRWVSGIAGQPVTQECVTVPASHSPPKLQQNKHSSAAVSVLNPRPLSLRNAAN